MKYRTQPMPKNDTEGFEMKGTSTHYSARLAGVLVILMLVLAACTPAPTPTPTPPTGSPQPGIGHLSASMVDLDEAVAGVDVRIYARTLDQNNGIYSGVQSIIYYLDATPPTTKGKPALTSAGTYKEMPQTEDQGVIWKNTPSGMHTFSVQLVNSDYTPLDPPVIAQVSIMVPSEISQKVPAIQSMTISSNQPYPSYYYGGLPPTSTQQAATSALGYEILVDASVYNFKLNDDKIGQANVPGEGHFIYYMDVDAPTIQGQPATTASGTYKITASSSYAWIQVPTGDHTFSIQLVNNDNTPLNPATIMKIAVTLPPETY